MSADGGARGADAGTAFGTWLKERRKGLGLTQKDLAERVDCSAVTIEKIESGERKPSGQVAELLAACMNVPEDEHRAFVEFARSSLSVARLAEFISFDSRSPWRALYSLSTSLPSPPTSFIGREKEAVAVCALVRMPGVRLVTLAGPPGIGKTRLSLEVAERLVPDFEDGVFFVPLAAVRDPELVASTIAQALRLQQVGKQPPMEHLKAFLRARRALIVLDNFEQIVPAASLVTDLLAAAPWLKIITTSREVLHIYGEHEFLVPQMNVANGKSPLPVEHLVKYEAVKLFVERAKASRPDFTLADGNAPSVVEICARLDGVPLAIELAAARVRTLEPQEIVRRLDSSLELLMGGARDLPPRQRALRSAIDWSYELLNEDERALFRCLSIFVGGCTLESAAAVARVEGRGSRVEGRGSGIGNGASDTGSRSPTPVQDTLDSLVDKSLLRREAAQGETRFTMLETVREYAGWRLVGRGEDEATWQRYASYFLGLAEQAKSQLRGTEQLEWLNRLEREHGNLRTVMRGAIERGDGQMAQRMGAALWKFWLTHGHLSEGRKWLQAALDMDREAATQVRADALNAAGNLAHQHGDIAAAQIAYEEGLKIRRSLGDKRAIASSLNNLALVAHAQGDYRRTGALHEESLAIKKELGDRWGIASSLGNLGIAAADQGDYDKAQTLHEESLAIRRELGDRFGVGLSLRNLGTVYAARGDYDAAQQLYNESLAIREELGDKTGVAECLGSLGELEHCRGHYRKAMHLHESSLEICRELADGAGIAYVLLHLSHVAQRQGQARRAATLLRESLTIRKDGNDHRGVLECLAAAAGVAMVQHRPEAAARIVGAAQVALEATGAHLRPVDRLEFERNRDAARTILDEAAWAAALSEGRTMSTDDAIALALAGA
jgi:predicted ATPase/transcriptional regulator with XRE-family HTH domain